MSHIQYTLCRSGRYYYNRRVPKHAVQAYGSFIRLALSKDPVEAKAYAKRLGNVLEGAWSNPSRLQPVDLACIIDSFKPRSSLLSEMAEEYLALRQIDQTPPRVALTPSSQLLVIDMCVSTHERMPSCLWITLRSKGTRQPRSGVGLTACQP